MKSLLKSIAFRTIATTGAPHRLHALLNHRQLSILMYHSVIDTPQRLPDWCCVETAAFRSQIRYLKSHFDIIPLSEAVKVLKHGKITRPTAVLTFDDGYQNNLDCALPVLRLENVPATVFLATGYIDTDATIWTGALHTAFENSSNQTLEWRGKVFDLSTTMSRKRALEMVKKELKTESHTALMSEIEKIIFDLTQGTKTRIDRNSPYRILDSESILKMAKSGLIEFGAHTHTHPILGNLNRQEQETEILKSIEIVRSVTNKPCSLFAYLNGSKSDYDSNSISLLEEAGIEASVTTIDGTCDSSTPIMELRRFGIGSDMDMASFSLTVHNVINRITKFR